MKAKYARGGGTSCELEYFCAAELWVNHQDSEATSLGGLSRAPGPRAADGRSVRGGALAWDSGDLALRLSCWPGASSRDWGSEAETLAVT